MYRLIGLAALLIAGPVSAAKVTIDYAKSFDFQTVKTFEYEPDEKMQAKDSLLDGRIVEMMKQKLTAAGLKEVTSNPDIYVTYHITTKETPVLNTFGGYGLGWGAWGGDATTTVSTYTEGTYVFDAYKASDNKLVWRGQGTVTVSSNPQKETKQVEDIIDKLGDRWQRILHNEKQ